ncbi:hypothetical protein ACVWQX_06570 [Neisseria meningitidis]
MPSEQLISRPASGLFGFPHCHAFIGIDGRTFARSAAHQSLDPTSIRETVVPATELMLPVLRLSCLAIMALRI